MWILFARPPKADKPYWAGRRLLAALDALIWPALALMALAQVSGAGGIARPMAAAMALLFGLCRLDTAWRRNHRYRFVTWSLARTVLALVLVGAVLKVMMAI